MFYTEWGFESENAYNVGKAILDQKDHDRMNVKHLRLIAGKDLKLLANC